MSRTVFPPMDLDYIEFSVESDCSSESREDNAKNPHTSEGIRDGERVHEIWNNPGRRWQPSNQGRLNWNRCQAHNLD